MKHLKKFNEIDAICKEYGITNYTINQDGSVDVNEPVVLNDMGLRKLPLKFGKVTGSFECEKNKLTSLRGSPKEVGGDFYCSFNQLITLEGAPIKVGDSFCCDNNQLVTLKGSPNSVGEDFDCSNNNLISLDGAPKEVDFFYCSNNNLISLDGISISMSNGFSGINCSGNPISQVYRLFGSFKEYQDSLDYGYLRGTDIVKLRFKEALEEIGKRLPKKVPGYNYI